MIINPNCPRCERIVARDQHSFGPWRDTFGPSGEPEGAERTHYIECDTCGLWMADECEHGGIGNIRHVTDPRLAASIRRKHIPAARVRPTSVGAC